jgi:hypothetical protein
MGTALSPDAANTFMALCEDMHGIYNHTALSDCLPYPDCLVDFARLVDDSTTSAPCSRGTVLRSTDAKHALTCRAPHQLLVLHHDEIVDIVRRELRRGVSSFDEGARSCRGAPAATNRGTDICCSLLRGSSVWVTSLSSTLGRPRTARRRCRTAGRRQDCPLSRVWCGRLPLCASSRGDLQPSGQAPDETHHRRA